MSRPRPLIASNPLAHRCSRLVERASESAKSNGANHQRERHDGPCFGKNLCEAVPFEQETANDAQEVSQGQRLADHCAQRGIPRNGNMKPDNKIDGRKKKKKKKVI
jgi:hypothetical protein